MKNRIVLIATLLIAVFLSGCNTTNTYPPTVSTNSPATGYPLLVTEFVQTAYPSTTTSETVKVDTTSPTQDPNMGSVKGILLLKGKPVENVMIYLGGLVTDDKGRELVAGYDRSSSMRAYTDENGNFTVNNVPEGRYGLILDLVTQAYLMNMPDGDQSILLTVKKGETTDLGILDYQELPGL